jgi:hypothetical protein
MNDQQKVSGIIYYPIDFHVLLTEYAKNMRLLAGTATRPKVADIYFHLFQKAGGMELLKTEIASLQEQVALLEKRPKSPHKRPGRPRKES